MDLTAHRKRLSLLLLLLLRQIVDLSTNDHYYTDDDCEKKEKWELRFLDFALSYGLGIPCPCRARVEDKMLHIVRLVCRVS